MQLARRASLDPLHLTEKREMISNPHLLVEPALFGQIADSLRKVAARGLLAELAALL